MYILSRIVATCVILSLLLRRQKKVNFGLFALFVLLMTTVLYFLPVENLFWTFKSPEAVHFYRNIRSSNDIAVISGEHFDIVNEHRARSDSISFVPKTEKGWKIGLNIRQRMDFEYAGEGIFMIYATFPNTADQFLMIETETAPELSISDSKDSKFVSICKRNGQGSPYCFYGVYLGSEQEPYNISVNGIDYLLSFADGSLSISTATPHGTGDGPLSHPSP